MADQQSHYETGTISYYLRPVPKVSASMSSTTRLTTSLASVIEVHRTRSHQSISMSFASFDISWPCSCHLAAF